MLHINSLHIDFSLLPCPCECIPERKNCYYRWSSYSAEWEKLFRLQMYLCVNLFYFCAWTDERKEIGRQCGNRVWEEKKSRKICGKVSYEGILFARMCMSVICVVLTCVCVYGWKEFRMDVNYRWEHFVTARFRGSHLLYLVSSISPSAESRVTILARVRV